jgi:hypothetical protein
MAKQHPDPLRERGEQRLAEWGLPSEATVAELSAVVLRDHAGDIAVAHRLGAIASQESAALLWRLERETSDKHVRKEAKRALYRLEQRGVPVPASATETPPTPVTAVPMEGYVSPVDGRGDQLVWLVKAQPGGLAHLFAVINDPEGMREAALNPVTRKALKSLRAELEAKHDLRVVDVDWRYADFLMSRAFEWARTRGTRMVGDYPALRAQLTRRPPPDAMPPMVFARMGGTAAAANDEALQHSVAVLEEPELRTWFLPEDQLKPYLDELNSVRDSPLVLNRMQQEERYDTVIARAVETVFGGELRASWARRLYEMAYFFAATRRPQRAEQATAVAAALEAGGAPNQIPFCADLLRASLGFFFKLALEQEEEREKTSLVLTPQQALARRAKRER